MTVTHVSLGVEVTPGSENNGRIRSDNERKKDNNSNSKNDDYLDIIGWTPVKKFGARDQNYSSR